MCARGSSNGSGSALPRSPRLGTLYSTVLLTCNPPRERGPAVVTCHRWPAGRLLYLKKRALSCIRKGGNAMRYRALCALCILCLWPMQSAAVTRDTFLIRYTQDLIELCTAPESDPMYTAAISFCHGYLIGTYHYQVALQSDPNEKPLFCLPEPQPTRQQGIQMFITWAKQNSQYMGERAVDTIVRFLGTQWPCK